MKEKIERLSLSPFLITTIRSQKNLGQMKNFINNLRTQLTSNEMLSTQQLYFVKGGDGEDLRRDLANFIATATTFIETAIKT